MIRQVAFLCVACAGLAAMSVAASGPSISGISPITGTVGTSVTIDGSNFGSSQGSNIVSFNGTVATVTSWATGEIVVQIPPAATSGNVVVTVSGLASNRVNFTVVSGITLAQAVLFENSLSASIPTAQTAGNYNVLAIEHYGQTINSVNDTAGNVYTRVCGPFSTNDGLTTDLEFWSSAPIAAAAPAANTVTINVSGTPAYKGALLYEVHTPSALAFDQCANQATLSGTSASSGTTATTRYANSFAIAVTNPSDSGVVPPGSPWTSDGDPAGTSSSYIHSFFSTTGTYSATWTSAVSQEWNSAIAVFGAPPAPPPAISTINTVLFENSLSASIPTAQTADNYNVLAIEHYGQTINSVSDTVGNIYTRACGPFSTNDGLTTDLEFWYSTPIAAAAPASNTVTINMSGTPAYKGAVFYEVNALNGLVFDQCANQVTTSGTSASSGTTATTRYANSYAIAVTNPSVDAITPSGLPWISDGDPAGTSSSYIHAFFSTSGAYSAAWTSPISQEWNSAIAVFGTPQSLVGGSGPVITQVTPDSAMPGQWISVAGTGFGSSQGSSSVALNGSAITPTYWSDTGIGFLLPDNADSGNLVVNVGGVPSFPATLRNMKALVGTYCPARTQGQSVAWVAPSTVLGPIIQDTDAPPNGSVLISDINSVLINMWHSALLPSWYWGAIWSGYQMPRLPLGATVQGVYEAASFTGSGSGAVEVFELDNPSPFGTTAVQNSFFFQDDDSIRGVCQQVPSWLYGNAPPQSIISGANISAFLYQTLQSYFGKSLSIHPAPGFAVYYTQPSPPTPSAALYLVDPYQLTDYTSGSVNPSTLISALSYAYASGIVADGTSTAVAVYQTNTPEDVTFSISGGSGATLSQFNEQFLLEAPSPGVTSLTVSKAQLLFLASSAIGASPQESGGQYYAFALVQAPLATSSSLFSTRVTVAAQPSVAPAPAPITISLLPKPVMFVHGLWGNKSSLASVSSYVQANLSYYPAWELNSICYSQYLPWNALSDSLPDSGKGCEDTAANQLNLAMNKFYQTLYSMHNVGGRVDVVAHSMGGLAARFYSQYSDYLALRNRMQGAFSTLLTIDTPDQGSALADYLVSHATSTSNNSFIWSSASCAPTDTLQQCFVKNNMPLAPAGQAPDCGAVGSLQTTYPGLANSGVPITDCGAGSSDAFVPITIPHTSRGVISAIYPDSDIPADDDKVTTTSLLRSILNGLVASVDSTNTLASILNYQDNDVIVTTGSQNAACGGTPAPFVNLEHTSALSLSPLAEAGLFAIGYSDTSVLDYADVNLMVSCWLWSGGTSSCSGALNSSICMGTGTMPGIASNARSFAEYRPTQEEQKAPGSSAPPSSRWFAANDRVEVVAPSQKFVLAEPNEISLGVQTPGLTTVSSNQRQYYFQKFSRRQEHDNLGDEPSEMVEGGSQILPVLHRADGSAYINVVPRRLGKMYLYLSGYFPDGGTFHTELVVDVEPPQRPPERLIVGERGMPDRSAPVIDVYLAGPVGPVKNSLNVYALYQNVEGRIEISSAFVTFKVRESAKAPVFDLDATTGILSPLRPGHALVETSYGGYKVLTCVLVEQDSSLQHSNRSRCEELLEPGEALAPFE